MRVKIIELAEIELNDAFEYYENELEDLGDRFLDEFNDAVNRILKHPHAWSLVKVSDFLVCKNAKFFAEKFFPPHRFLCTSPFGIITVNIVFTVWIIR